jgi:hypothetical protein
VRKAECRGAGPARQVALRAEPGGDWSSTGGSLQLGGAMRGRRARAAVNA